MKKILHPLGLILIILCLLPALALAEKGVVDPEKVFQGHQLIEDWDIEAADALTQALLKEYPESGDAHFLNARVQFMKGNYAHALKILSRVDDSTREVKDFKTLVENTRKASAAFISRESEHFIFRFVPGPDEVLLHYASEVLEKSYAVLGDLLDYRPGEKILVEIYPDRVPFSKISPLTLEDILTSGTVALCKYNRIMMISPGSLVRGYNWMDTLSHEYTHYLLTRKSRNHLPLWMHEGIAKYIEAHWRDEKKFLDPLMETVLATGLANDYLISLDSMMPSFAKLKTAEDVQLAYAEVATMIDYLVSIRGEKVFPLLLNDLAAGKSFEEVLQQRTDADLARFQEGWKQYMKTQKLKSIPGIKYLAMRFKESRKTEEDEKDYTEVADAKARDLTFLGDILKSRNLQKAAMIEYEKAIRETESFSPVLYNKLAATRILNKDYDEAEPLLHESLKYYPMFHSTQINLGELYFATGRFEQALEYFNQAVRTNPFNPFAHLRLIDIYQRLGKPKEKELQAGLLRYIQ